MKPIVSVICITYNHEKYISQALEGFVMQKTDFPFEILIHDDASTDKTASIIREYEQRNQNKNATIKPIYESKNQYSKGNYEFINDMFRAAKGTYIAFCEGDDYWTDPEKLQRQVDFLDTHPDYAVCFHPVRVFFENNEEEEFVYPETKDKSQFTVKKLLQHNFIQTNSVMYRRQKYENLPADIMPSDIYLHLYHAQFGKIGFIDKVMAAYRRHPGGVWWDSYEGEDEIWKKYALAHLALFIALNKLYSNQAEYKAIIDTAIDNMFNKLAELDNKYSKSFLQRAVLSYPEATAELIARQHQEMSNKMKELQNKDQEILKLQHAAVDAEQQIIEKDQIINAIHASRVWKARNKVAKLRGHEKV